MLSHEPIHITWFGICNSLEVSDKQKKEKTLSFFVQDWVFKLHKINLPVQ